MFTDRKKTKWTAGNLLYILGPFRGITEGHESTVGQDGEHDQHAEHRRKKVKEHNGTFVFFSIYPSTLESCGTFYQDTTKHDSKTVRTNIPLSIIAITEIEMLLFIHNLKCLQLLSRCKA